MKVPAFLLRRLYVPGTLRNTSDGWEFFLRNSIAGGEATGLDPVVVDGEEISVDACFFHEDSGAVCFADVDQDHRASLAAGRDIRISVRGEPLAPGRHTVVMGFTVPGIGRLGFDLTDDVA